MDNKPLVSLSEPEKYFLEKWRKGGLDKQDILILILSVIFLLVVIMLGISSTLLQAKTAPNPADFSGNWILDSSQTKDLPAGLQSYNIIVDQDKQRLKVQTSLQGDLQSIGDPSGPYPGGRGAGRPGGYPGRRQGGMGRIGIGMPGGGGAGGPMGEGMPGGGMPGGGGGRPRESQSQGRIAAFTLYPSRAVYKLDGSESTAQLGAPAQSEATLKAEWAKSGQVLKLSLVGNGDSGQRGGKTRLREEWKFSKDGRFLMVARAVHSPSGSGTVHLVFRKQDAGSANSAVQGHMD